MKLLFDIGNTSIDWATEKNGEFIRQGKLNHGAARFREQFIQELDQEITRKPDHILVSNVGQNNIMAFIRRWSDRWQLEPWQPQVLPGFNKLKNAYADTSQMGIDRWLAMVAAWEKYQTALCVVDCGSALTIDVIDESGTHLGGWIIPGIVMMQQVLIQNTSKINIAFPGGASVAPGDDTQHAVSHGACLATVAVIEHAMNIPGLKPKCILSGGAADLIKPLLRLPFIHDPNIVLQGLSLVYKALQ